MLRPARLALLLLCVLGASVDAAAGVRRALLVGVGSYPEQYGWPALPGACADVALVRRALLAREFRAEDVVVLLNEHATRAAIVGELEKLAAASTREDLVFVYFAGHGSRLPDQGHDELDPYDETLVPYDAGAPPTKANDLRDDVLGDWIARANRRTEQIVLVFDCCSSGTNTRGGGTSRYLDPRARGFDAPRASLAPEAELAPDARGSGYAPAGRRYVALSACRSNESAYELSVREKGAAEDALTAHGAFTWHFVKALDELGPDATWTDLLARASAGLRADERRQTPVIEGPLGAYRLFTNEAAKDARRFELERAEDGTWRLAAGALDGLTEGALLAVLPAGSRRDELGRRLGRVRIARTGREASLVRWVDADGASDAVAPEFATEDGAPQRARAFLLEPGSGGLRLGFALAGDDAATTELTRRLEATNLLARCEPSDADVLITRERTAVRERWRVQSRRGRALPLAAALDSQEDLARLIDDLARLASARRVRALLEDDATDALDVAFEARAGASADASAAARELEERADGARLVPAGGRIELAITNRSTVPLAAAVLWFGPDGEVSWVGGTSEEEVLGPGQSLRLGLDELALPAGREAYFAETPVELVCVASPRWHDYTPLFQAPAGTAAARGAAGGGDPLACEGWTSRALRLALSPAVR